MTFDSHTLAYCATFIYLMYKIVVVMVCHLQIILTEIKNDCIYQQEHEICKRMLFAIHSHHHKLLQKQSEMK